MTTTAAAIAPRVAPAKLCRDCGGLQWVFEDPIDRETNSKAPCPTCKPYGPRVAATSVHADGAYVTHRYSNRVGRVLRSWRATQGPKRPGRWVMCDVRYMDDGCGVAWEQDLVPYVEEPDAVPFDLPDDD